MSQTREARDRLEGLQGRLTELLVPVDPALLAHEVETRTMTARATLDAQSKELALATATLENLSTGTGTNVCWSVMIYALGAALGGLTALLVGIAFIALMHSALEISASVPALILLAIALSPMIRLALRRRKMTK